MIERRFLVLTCVCFLTNSLTKPQELLYWIHSFIHSVCIYWVVTLWPVPWHTIISQMKFLPSLENVWVYRISSNAYGSLPVKDTSRMASNFHHLYCIHLKLKMPLLCQFPVFYLLRDFLTDQYTIYFDAVDLEWTSKVCRFNIRSQRGNITRLYSFIISLFPSHWRCSYHTFMILLSKY